jgi:hypothetical protein
LSLAPNQRASEGYVPDQGATDTDRDDERIRNVIDQLELGHDPSQMIVPIATGNVRRRGLTVSRRALAHTPAMNADTTPAQTTRKITNEANDAAWNMGPA